MIPLSNLPSTTPLLDGIQSRNCQRALEEVKEGAQNIFEIEVKNKIHRFLICKDTKKGHITAKYEGDFRVVIQKDSIELIEKLIYQAPEVIRFRCRDINDNLLVHVLCWSRSSKIWITLARWACYSAGLFSTLTRQK